MNLSKNFTLEEMTVTDCGLANVPNQEQRNCMNELVKNVLQPLRDTLGMPIKITSGFRSIPVNKAVGGADRPISQHTKGQAADLKCADNSELFSIIRDHLVFDQLIWEKGNDVQPAWVHVSYKTQGNRGEILKFKNGKYQRI